MSTTKSTPTSDSQAATESTPVVADLSFAPLPTKDTLRKRQSIPLQLMRFASFNTRMAKMVLKGHGNH